MPVVATTKTTALAAVALLAAAATASLAAPRDMGRFARPGAPAYKRGHGGRHGQPDAVDP
jgi:hypothetical protein